MHTNNHRAVHIAEGVLIGATLGLATGLLFAPKSGKDLRRDLAKDARKDWKKVTHLYSDTHARVDRMLENANEKAEALIVEAEDRLREARAKAKEILSRS